VIIVKVNTSSPSAGVHRSHRPAKAKGSPPFNRILNGTFTVSRFHSKKPVAGTRHLLDRNALLNEGFSVIVSPRALMSFDPMEASLAQDGISPHRK
jgi:hypothetical protein